MTFDRNAFQQRAAAVLKDDLNRNGRITLDGLAMVGAEAEFYAKRAALAAAASGGDAKQAPGDSPAERRCESSATPKHSPTTKRG